MKIGVAFPSMEIKTPAGAREFAQGAESLGFHHLMLLEHALGTRDSVRPGGGGYTPETHMHEPFVLFGYLAGLTSSIEFVTSVLILPQRQAVLVARQAAELDMLSGGRVRLGVGLGSIETESRGMGMDFHTRGARAEEQVEVMRALWTQPVVTFQGRWHDIKESGLTVLPVQQPIPLWMGGGHSARTLERIGRMTNGWMAPSSEGGQAEQQLAVIHEAAKKAGRDPASIGLQGRVSLARGGPDDWMDAIRRWQELGATHVAVNTRDAGLASPKEHLERLEHFLNTVGREVAS